MIEGEDGSKIGVEEKGRQAAVFSPLCVRVMTFLG